MPLSICFDALGTCFTLEPVISALEKVMGDKLSPGLARMIVTDWFHAAQRDYTYTSITSPPPPAIATILKSTLPRSIAFALNTGPSLTSYNLPDLQPVYEKLKSLTPSQGLENGWKRLSEKGDVLVITNGAKATTQGYIDQAGLTEYVKRVQSCDEVGLAKPAGKVYEMAHAACNEVSGKGSERWFVAAHMWDLHAARKAGFKTALVLFEQPNLEGGEVSQQYWEIFGGKPDVIGVDHEEVAEAIIEASVV